MEKMIDKQLLEILVCPKDHTPLKPVGGELLARINRAIAAGKAENLSGRAIEEPLSGGLVRQDEALLYPIVDDIPVLLIDEAIALEQIDG